jgi:esterase/lipase superfamily enzyme
MMTNRKLSGDKLGHSIADMRYFEHSKGPITKLSNWAPLTKKQFADRLIQIAGTFPQVPEEDNEEQKHVSVFIHGYNNEWEQSVTRYDQVRTDLFDSHKLGQLILFAWPSNGSAAAYLPDREDARGCADALALELKDLHDYMVAMQRLIAQTQDPTKACKAKLSIIAHSMGNYVAQKALAVAAKKLNSPQLLTLITQLAMVAADVDNDLFQRDKPGDSDGSLMANVCYRIGALFTGLDQVLGASAGLKHFGTRRLGRSGLSDRSNVWDNVFDVDVSAAIKKTDVHSAVFDSPRALRLLEQVLRGIDRKHLAVGA